MTLTNTVALSQPQRPGQWPAFGAVARYEFLMQIRRVTFWILFAVGALVPIIQRGQKMTSLEQKGEQTKQALEVAQCRYHY